MILIKAGHGLQMNKKQSWVDAEEITICELSLDGLQDIHAANQHISYIQPCNIAQNVAKPGDVLMINEQGHAIWTNPTERFNDETLRDSYPALEDAWQKVLAALYEYELAKKLVQDHDR